MGKKHEITPEERKIVVEIRFNNISYRAIAKSTNIPHSIVQSVIKRLTDSGTVISAPRNGRTLILSSRNLRKLKNVVIKNRRVTLHEIQSELPINVSTKTIGRKLAHLGYSSKMSIKNPSYPRRMPKEGYCGVIVSENGL